MQGADDGRLRAGNRYPLVPFVKHAGYPSVVRACKSHYDRMIHDATSGVSCSCILRGFLYD